MQERTALILANIALGLWVLATPVLMVFFFVGSAVANHLIVGLAVIALAVARVRGAGPMASWANVALGLWLAAAPWVLGYVHTDAHAMPSLSAGTDLITGLLIAATAALAAMLERRTHRGAVFASAMPDEREAEAERRDRLSDR